MKKLIAWLQWLDENLLKILIVGFIAIIPLYPKLPLFGINYTYIAVRLEDIYVVFIAFAFLVQLLRRKIKLSTRFLITIGLFWLAVMASFLYGAYVQKSIDYPKVGFLHAARRIEYMLIFFIAGSTVQSKKDFLFYLKAIFVVLGLVAFYGLGQKFFGWQAVQTMNPEFAKGYLLTLDAAARISSTFAGHYDLAAYLIFLIPILLGTFVSLKEKKYFALFVLVLSALVFTASRVSYISYLVSVVAYLIWIRKWKLLLAVIVLTAVLTPLSDNLTTRITRTFQYQKIYIDPKTGKAIVPKDIRPDDLPPGDVIIGKIDTNNLPPVDPNAQKIDTSKDAKLAKEQIRDRIIREAKQQGKKLTPQELEALVNAQFLLYIPKYSWLPDISQSTRFGVEWPRAIAAFLYNPILGKGPSSITEATDNDYLRWLGEFGLVGTLFFLFLLFSIVRFVWKHLKNTTADERPIYLGFLFGMAGLLINATYIDVFEASKVAYTYWLLTGLVTAAIPLPMTQAKPAVETKPVKKKQKVKK